MKVEDLGLGQANQNLNSYSNSSPFNKKTIFYNLLSLYQIESHRLQIISIIASIYSLLQNIFISFWPHLDFTKKQFESKYDYIRTPLVFEENLTNAFFLYSTDREPDYLYLFSFMIFLPSIIFFFLSLTCFCLYYFKRIINYRLLFCFSIFIQFICPIITVPLGFQTGWLISRVTNMRSMERSDISTESLGSTDIFIALIVLNFFLFIIVILLTILINIFNSYSIIFIGSYFSSHNGIFQSFVQLFPSVLLFFSNVLPLFHKSTRYVIASLHIAYCILTTIGCFWIPFIHVKVNSLIASVSVSMIISDIICFTKFNLKWQRYIIFIGIFIVLFFLFDFFIKLRIKFIFRKYLAKEDENEQETADKSSRSNLSKKKLNYNIAAFQSYNDFILAPTGFEDLTIKKQLFLLKIALITKNKVFLDGRLIDLIATKAESDQDKIELACLICYFPDFQAIYFAIATGLKRAQFIPLLKDFQLFQLRCFDASCHQDVKIAQVDEAVQEASALSINLRYFWQLIDSECDSNADYNEDTEINDQNNNNNNPKYKLKVNLFSYFDRISRSIENIENKWRSILSFYPNNIMIADEYSKFLIEFCGDFIGASEWKTVALQMKDGKVFRFNPFIVSFLRTFPFYYHQIVGKQSFVKSFDDIDIYKKIENVSDLIEMPEARFEFQRSARSSYPISICLFLILSIFPLIFIIAFWVYGFYSFSQFDHVIDGLYFVVNTGFLGQQISKNLISAILDYGQLPSVGVAPTPDEIFSTLYANNNSDRADTKEVRSLIPITGEYKSSLSAVSERGMGLIDYLHNVTLEQIEKGNNFQLVLDSFYSNTLISTYYFNKTSYLQSNSNLQSMLITFFTYYFTMSYDFNYSYVDDPECYHASMAGAHVLDRLDIISQSTIENSKLLFEDRESFYSTCLYALTGVYFVISIFMSWIDFFFIIRSFKKICNSLCYFPKSVKQKASSPIIKEKISVTTTANNDQNNNKSKNDDLNDPKSKINETAIEAMKSKFKNFIIIALIIASIINLILGFIILYFHFYYEKYRNNLTATFELTHYYSIETAQVIEVLYAVMAGPTFGQIIPLVDEKYKKRISDTINKFSTTHQNTGTFSYAGDCGVSGLYLDLLNDLKTKQKCLDFSNKTTHETLSCLSEEAMIYAYIDMAQTLESNAEDPLLLKTTTFKQFIHFSLSHVYYEVRNFGNYLLLSALEKVVVFDHTVRILGSISIAIACLLFLVNIYIFLKIRKVFKILFVFISRVLPSDIVKNSELLKSLFGIKNLNKVKIENGGTSFLVQESSSPIIFIDRSTLIEFVNNAFINTFGIEPNFIVGQPISRIIEDEEVLFLIDTLKFFGTRQVPVKTVKCTKRNGNKATFDITIVPIVDKKSSDSKKLENVKSDDKSKDSNSKSKIVHRLAIIFVDKTTKKNLKKRCILVQKNNQKLIDLIFPPFFQLYAEGQFKMCAICLIKFTNNISKRRNLDRILTQRQNTYQLLYDKLSVYPLLLPLFSKNGIFAVVGCKKDDPTELAIECLNFVLNVIDEMALLITSHSKSVELNVAFNGPFHAVIETGGELIVGWSGSNTMQSILSGELMDRALKVLDYAPMVGNVCVSKKTYEYIIQHDYSFVKKKIPEEICGVNAIYSVDSSKQSDSYDVGLKSSHGTSESESNICQTDSLNFIEKLKEDETIQMPSEEYA